MLVDTEFRGETVKAHFTGYVIEPSGDSFVARKGVNVVRFGTLEECQAAVKAILDAQGLAFDFVPCDAPFVGWFRAEVR